MNRYRQCSTLPVTLSARPAPAAIKAVLFLLLCLWLFPSSPVPAANKEKQSSVEKMIRDIRNYGFKDSGILQALRKVPRHKFVPDKYHKLSYRDTPISIGHGQTISQPFIVAEMTRLLDLSTDSKVLEIGTGSGYQAAVLAEITDKVYSVEIIEPLVKRATTNLKSAGYSSVLQRHGDGYYGWPEKAPFDGIIVTCAAGHVPPPLLKQLAPGGKMVIPVGKRFGTQHLIVISKELDGTISSRSVMPVRFVPLVRK